MTIFTPRRKKSLGFTLVELAIVLAVTGVLFLGLYRLLSGGNAQVKDSSVASQQIQLINAVRTFLATSDGATWMGTAAGADGSNDVASQPISLPLPPLANAPNGTDNLQCKNFYGNANEKSFCDSLPAGFVDSTLNAYGQSFKIQVLTGAITHPAKTPSTYSFMIVTSGGDVIPDADGGRISSQIGTDGGFIYATAGACSKQACGSYGAWAADITSFGFNNALDIAGHVVSRSYASPESSFTDVWLARKSYGSDSGSTNPSPEYNTMKTDLYLGSKNLWLANNNLTSAPYTTTGTINVQGGVINLQGGRILDSNSTGDALDISVPVNSYLVGPPTTTQSAFLNLTTRCTADPLISPPGVAYHSDCQVALFIVGDENVFGRVQAYDLYSGTFIYESSDRRLKKDIVPLANGLDAVMHMQPVSFAFKEGGQKGLGFIAQDIETIYPQLVASRSDGMKAVNYEGLVAPLVSAVQELKKQNDELRSQLLEQGKQLEKIQQQAASKTK